MSGHSKWSTIKRAKGAADAKRGAVFTKLGNQIAIAARSGADPTMNSSLALAIDRAKAANMPSSTIQRAIDRVKDKNAAQLEEVIYEGYGPGGIAIIIEAATDNKNRTLPDVKNALAKNGGNIAEPGSVAFQFNHKGVITLEVGSNDADEMLLGVLDSGAEDAVQDDDKLIIYTDPKQLHSVKANLEATGYKIDAAELSYVPTNQIMIDNQDTA
ncbi:MAG TPA: YebC/PmpR family DNA-binding transcriptional regulator, partial [Candidatus Saccharimonadales bacterium]|nr:YebC/PmpR family DNA-binding transcriptional regulator [Candidatus Saccharimonadales bacterium]